MNNNLNDLIFLTIINYKIISQYLDESEVLTIELKIFRRVFDIGLIKFKQQYFWKYQHSYVHKLIYIYNKGRFIKKLQTIGIIF